jgi:hypothetical protein
LKGGEGKQTNLPLAFQRDKAQKDKTQKGKRHNTQIFNLKFSKTNTTKRQRSNNTRHKGENASSIRNSQNTISAEQVQTKQVSRIQRQNAFTLKHII